MRLRYVPGQYEYLKNHNMAITEPEQMYSKLNNYFDNNNPIYVELGCGKGQFLKNQALQNQDINFFGFEKSVKVAYRCVKALKETDSKNFFIVYSNGDILTQVFNNKSIDRIYLNFSDPWPKPCNYKRRLTHKNFLKIYEDVLSIDGEIHMKTDNNDLFEFSVKEFQENGWEILSITRDLHKSIYNEINIETEYEIKFASEGKKINMLTARKKCGE